MSIIIPRDIRTNPVSTAVWLASKRRNRLRSGGYQPDYSTFAAYYGLGSNGNNSAASGVATILRDSPKNIPLTNSNIATFQDNEGAYTGDCLSSEGKDTNYATESTNPITWNERGVGDVSPSSQLAPDTNYTMAEVHVAADNDFGNPKNDVFRYFQGTPELADLGISFWIKKITQTGVIRFSNATGSLGWWNIDLDKIGSGAEKITRNHEAVSVIQEFSSDASALRSGFLFSALNTGELDFYYWQHTVNVNSSHNVSSDIYTTVAPQMRDRDVVTTPNSDAFTDANHGLTGSGVIPLAGTKYDGALDVNCIGSLFGTSTATHAEIIAYAANTITVDSAIVSGDSLDFSKSAYDLAGVHALRASVGDYGNKVDALTVEFPPLNQDVSVSGGLISIDGNFTTNDLLAGITFDSTSKTEISTTALHVNVDVNLSQGAVDIAGFSVSNGNNQDLYLSTGGATESLPLSVPIVLASGDSAILGTVKFNTAEILDWKDFPTNNFKLSLTVTAKQETEGYILNSYKDINNYISIDYVESTNEVIFLKVVGGIVVADLKVFGVISYDEELLIEYEQSDTTGIKFSVNGVEATSPSSSAITWDNVTHLGSNDINLGAPLHFNGCYKNFIVKDL